MTPKPKPAAYDRAMSRPRGRTAAPRARETPELVKMAVLAKRSGVPTPTIKHYIREGLLPGPAVRTSKNMAYYDVRVVDRIRAIKALQAERFLPLRVIGEMLEPSPSAKLRSDAKTQRRTLGAVASVVANQQRVHRRRRTEILKTTQLTRAELTELERSHVIQLEGKGDTAGYSGADLAIVELAADMHRLGYGEIFPVALGADYLRAIHDLVAVEAKLFRKYALHAALPAPLPEAARQAMQFGERMIAALRAKLLPKVLAELAPRDDR